MRPADMPTTEEARRGFYPTPPKLAGMMLAGLDFRSMRRVLEPSAGKGNLVRALAGAVHDSDRWRHNYAVEVDCVEIDPYLRQILKYEFSEEARKSLYDEKEPLDRVVRGALDTEQQARLSQLERELDIFQRVNVRVVHDDFFTFRTHQRYSLCLMNPPFSNGDLHLLRAIEIMRYGGKIVCLLNAETIRNPYTNSRKILSRKLDELDAEIQYVDGAFRDAERQTNVEVAIVRIDVPTPEYHSTIYAEMKKAADRRLNLNPELKELVTTDYLAQAVQMYQVEVEATVRLIQEYHALVPYMRKDIAEADGLGDNPILDLVVDHGNSYGSFDYPKYMRLVRLKYWRALLKNEKFVGKLTSELRERYRSEVEKLAEYEFSLFNIRQVYFDMQESMSDGIEGAIMALFDKLTVEHTWYPESKQNIHYYNGWKTNQAHKVGAKCIIPVNMYATQTKFQERGGWKEIQEFSESKAFAALSDLEKTLDYLSAQPVRDGYDLKARLAWIQPGQAVRNIELKYFKLDAYKKGTIHIKFLPEAMPIVERLNIFAGRKRGWLPPNYGKSDYSDMDAEEKTVVDAFHGDGAAGSGESAYAEVMRDAAFYLSAPTRKLPELMAPATE